MTYPHATFDVRSLWASDAAHLWVGGEGPPGLLRCVRGECASVAGAPMPVRGFVGSGPDSVWTVGAGVSRCTPAGCTARSSALEGLGVALAGADGEALWALDGSGGILRHELKESP